MNKNEIVLELTNFFSQKPQFDTILLFGSFADGKNRPDSDADIAVHTDKRLSPDEILDMQTELTLLLHIDVDLVDLRQCEGVFLHEIMCNNIRIRYNHDTYHYYLMKSLIFIEDEYPIIRRLQREKLRRYLNEPINA